MSNGDIKPAEPTATDGPVRVAPGTATNSLPASIAVAPLKIWASQTDYVVVLDREGNVPDAYPILEFTIMGPPGYTIDIQVARHFPSMLEGGPGLQQHPWDKLAPRKRRIDEGDAFSSWTNGDVITLDGSGRASYRMPLEWWKDQAFRPLDRWSSTAIYFRALAMSPSAMFLPPFKPTLWSATDRQQPQSVTIYNNLVRFGVNGAYSPLVGERQKNVGIGYDVRAAGTTDMYTIVQWKMGRAEIWPRTNPNQPRYAVVTQYGRTCWSYHPNWVVDAIDMRARYEGRASVQNHGLRFATSDLAGWEESQVGATDTHLFYAMDFRTCVCLNCDVSESLTVTLRDDVYEGTIEPKPLVVAEEPWTSRVLITRVPNIGIGGATRELPSHPDTFDGPPVGPSQ